MEGYSVTEAASVLGVPTARVWELLARGVLSGVPDGETGMRVFLQPRPAPPVVDELRRSNGRGDARGPDPEASPFRELLTEFRSLTERYGQALLALGEARGEVASLRSRVDLLEARMDLRLPTSSTITGGSTWESRAQPPSPAPAPDAAPASDESSDAEPPTVTGELAAAEGTTVGDEPGAEPEAEPPARRKRGRGHFTDEFADALARAEDPSPAVLPRAAASGGTFATHRYEVAAGQDKSGDADATDALLPREVPAAESMTDIEPAPEMQSEAEPAAEPESAAVAAAEPEPEAVDEAAPEPEAEPEPEAAVEPEAAAEPAPDVEPSPQSPEPVPGAEPMAAAEPEAAVEPEREPEPQPQPEALGRPEPEVSGMAAASSSPTEEPAAEPTWDRERYSADIEEPDWWGPELSEWPMPEGPTTERSAEDPLPTSGAMREHDGAPTSVEPMSEPAYVADTADIPDDATASTVEPEPEPVSPERYRGEETMLWFGRRPDRSASTAWPVEDAAAEMEVASTGRRGPVEPGAPTAIPGSDELQSALAALDAVPSQRELTADVAPDTPQAAPNPAALSPRIPSAPAQSPAPTGELRSPASRAYRRLRRIFPG